jgi:hypothetical protein
MSNFKDYYNKAINSASIQNITKYKEYIIPIIAVIFLFLFTKLGNKSSFIPKVLNSVFTKIIIAIILCGILYFNNVKFSIIIYFVIFLLYWVLESCGKENFSYEENKEVTQDVPNFNIDGCSDECKHRRFGCTHQEGNECNDCINYMELIDNNGDIFHVKKMPDGQIIPIDDEKEENNEIQGENIEVKEEFSGKEIYDSRDFAEVENSEDNKIKYVKHQICDRNIDVICPKPKIMNVNNFVHQPILEEC